MYTERVKVMIRDYVFTIQEAADDLSMNRITVSRWLKAGSLSGETIGGVVLVPRWTVEMLKQEREAKGRKRPRRRAAVE